NTPGNGKFLYSAYQNFSGEDCRRFFAELGVESQEEEGGKIFTCRGAASLIEAFHRAFRRFKVDLRYGWEGEKLILAKGICRGIQAKGQKLAGRVVVSTGGLSYPATGCTGKGYELARQAGHQIRGFWPSGVGVLTRPNWGKEQACQGVACSQVELTLSASHFKPAKARGAIIFTHFGLSGPAVFRLSREIALYLAKNSELLLQVDFFPEYSKEALLQVLAGRSAKMTAKEVFTLLKELLPARLSGVILAQAKIAPNRKLVSMQIPEWQKLVQNLKSLPFTIYQTRPLKEAIVTVGGVAVKEINPRTMESRLAEGLYFAGEVLDLDAYTGGYNLQMAWATGRLAGQAAALY
ncbi:MAG: aminoacetone oxidase family FAD-binding enzyme, partial [Clostridia bacterium]|nr:aminoacetone oxidase family FAD-binding enzyme [Clostridia bacterium]